MSAPTITMNPPPGTAPSTMHLTGGKVITPNPNGTYTVPAEEMQKLIGSGWQIVITDPTHVP